MIVATRHAKRRVRERLGLPGRAARAEATRALRDGVSADTAGPMLAAYLRRHEAATNRLTGGADARVVIHRGVAWVFAGEQLRTVWLVNARWRRAEQEGE